MFAKTNDYLTGRKPAPTPAGAELLVVRAVLTAAAAELTANNVGAVLILPPGCIPVDVQVDGPAAAAQVLAVGVLNDAGTDLSTAVGDGGGAWGSTVASGAAYSQRLVPNGQALVNVAPSNVDRKVAIKVTTAPSAPANASIGVSLFYRSV